MRAVRDPSCTPAQAEDVQQINNGNEALEVRCLTSYIPLEKKKENERPGPFRCRENFLHHKIEQ